MTYKYPSKMSIMLEYVYWKDIIYKLLTFDLKAPRFSPNFCQLINNSGFKITPSFIIFRRKMTTLLKALTWKKYILKNC